MPVSIAMPQRQKSTIDALNDGLGVISRAYEMKLASDKSGRESDEYNKKLQLEKALKDPTSQQSAMARRAMQQAGVQVDDNASAFDIDQAYGGPAKYNLAKQEALYKRENKDPVEEAFKKAQTAKVYNDMKKEKQPTDGQYSSGTFAKRMEQAENVFTALSDSGYNAADMSNRAGSILPGAFQSENFKKQDQAERNFVNALLRRESGAAISPDEFKSAAIQYFPRAGDTPDVLEQKRQNRILAFNGLKANAGPAFDKIPSVGPSPLIAKTKQSGGVIADAVAGSGEKPTAEDMQALQWAKGNAGDPRAKDIMARLKLKGLK